MPQGILVCKSRSPFPVRLYYLSFFLDPDEIVSSNSEAIRKPAIIAPTSMTQILSV
jgi:hypothetical protein